MARQSLGGLVTFSDHFQAFSQVIAKKKSSLPTVCLLLQMALKSSSRTVLTMSLRHMFSSWFAAATSKTDVEARSQRVALSGSSDFPAKTKHANG